MWSAWMTAFPPIVFVMIGCTLESALALLTLMTPPDEPDEDAVAVWSPVGAPASAALPPTPSSVAVPLPGEMSRTRFWRHGGGGVCVPPCAALLRVPPPPLDVGGPPGGPPVGEKEGRPPAGVRGG